MSLEFQTVDVRFDKGLDTRTEKKLVIPGKWNQLQNCTLSEDGTPQRRDGSVALVAAATGNGLATYNNQLLTVNGSALSSISTGGTDQAVAVSGRIGNVGVSKQEIRRSTGMQDSPDVASGGGYTCYVWRELDIAATATGLRVSVFDETTGTPMLANAALITSAAAFCPRVVFGAATQGEPACFFIFYNDGIDDLFCRVITVTAPTVLGTQTSLISSASLAGLNFDACTFGSDGSTADSTAAVVYAWADGTTSIRTIQVTQAASVPSILAGPTNVQTQANLPVATLHALAIKPFNGLVCGIFSFASGASAMDGTSGVTIDDSWGVLTAATNLIADGPTTAANCTITATSDGGGRLQLFTDRRSAWSTAAINVIKSFRVTSALAIFSGPNTVANSASFAGTTTPRGPQGPWIAGKAFTSGTNTYLPVWVMENYANLSVASANPRTSNEQNTVFLLDTTNAGNASFGFAPVVAKALYGALGCAAINGNAPMVSSPCSTPTVSGGFAFACTERTLLSFVGGFNVSPSGVVRLTFAPNFTVPPIRMQLGESGYFAGGSLAAFDGLAVTEHGFPLFPEGIDVELVSGGGSMTAGVHQVVVISEWIDNAGQRHQSAPSLAVSVTTAANDRLRVRAPSLLLSQKAGVTLVPYVTQSAGTTFNRAVSASGSGAGTANDTTAASTTLALIDAADTVYAANELLYTQPNTAGTTLPNLAPGPCNAVAPHQNRVWFDKADQPGQFGYSQSYANNIGLRFNEALSGAVDVSGGRIVGFSSMDEKVIIFCDHKPFVVYGSGPDGSGGFSSYGEPREVPSDVGCSEARSILEMPQGIIFKSLKGWYLLGRDLQVRYIGDGVAAFDANSVSSAVLLADRQECRFTSASGTQLIYSYDVNGGEWSTTVYRAQDHGGGIAAVAVADAAYWTTLGRYVTLSLTHGLNQDTPGVFLDKPGVSLVALAIPTTGRTAWLRMAIINGFQRVRKAFLTGTSPTAPTSTLVVSVDFDDAYGQVAPGSYSFTVAYGTMFPTFTVGNPVDFRHSMQHQKCKSVAFTFVDTPTAANPAGVNFQALSLELGLKRGLKKLPAAQST